MHELHDQLTEFVHRIAQNCFHVVKKEIVVKVILFNKNVYAELQFVFRLRNANPAVENVGSSERIKSPIRDKHHASSLGNRLIAKEIKELVLREL